jgi:hypothetical protein
MACGKGCGCGAEHGGSRHHGNRRGTIDKSEYDDGSVRDIIGIYRIESTDGAPMEIKLSIGAFLYIFTNANIMLDDTKKYATMVL